MTQKDKLGEIEEWIEEILRCFEAEDYVKVMEMTGLVPSHFDFPAKLLNFILSKIKKIEK